MFINLAYAFFTCFRGDKHDYLHVIPLCNGAEVFLIVFERKVGNDDSVNAAFGALPAEVVKAELHDRVEISHQD